MILNSWKEIREVMGMDGVKRSSTADSQNILMIMITLKILMAILYQRWFGNDLETW